MIQIKHPKALAFAVVLTAFAGAAVVAFADNGPRQDPDGLVATNIPITPAATPSAEESAAVESFVRQSAGIEQMNGGQPYQVSEAAFRSVAGHARAFAVTVSWEVPVTARQRWTLLRCQGTRLYEPEVTWRDVTTVIAVVDVERQELISLGVTAPTERESTSAGTMPRRLDDPAPGESTLTDLRSGKLISTGTYTAVAGKAEQCPADLSDD